MLEVIDCKKLYVYGAGFIAKNLILYLRVLYPELNVEVIISEKAPTNLFEGCKLYTINDTQLEDKETMVIIATSARYHEEIAYICKKNGYNNLLFLKPKMEWVLHQEYVRKVFPVGSLSDLDISATEGTVRLDIKYNDKIKIFTVFSAKDKNCEGVKNSNIFRQPIFAGAALQKESTEYLVDSCGDNISKKNRQYCELTALYWAWKNCRNDYYGIEHYRRIFEFDSDSMRQMIENSIDVVLPKPTALYTSLERHYLECHEMFEWEVMKNVINKYFPHYNKVLDEVIHSNIFYEYNMIIAKRDVINEYCEWLFTILSRVENEVGEKKDIYQNRYIGFLAERLLTVFFTANKNRYKIAHANVKMLF